MSHVRIRTFITVAAASALLTSCFGAGSGGGQGQEKRGPSTEECPDGAVILSVLRSVGNLPTDEQIERYQAQNPCVEFEVDEVPFGQLNEKISILASSNNPPDIIGYDGPNTQTYASQGILLPLDDYLPDEWYDDILPATLTEHSWDGKVYSPGIEQAAMALYYNKEMTDAAGIEVPTSLEDAWTWEEARDAFEACQHGSGANKVWGLAPSRLGDGKPGVAYRDLPFLRSAGDPDAPEDSSAYRTYWALSPDGNEVDGWLNTPEAIEAAEFYQGLFNGPDAVTSKTGIPNALIDGKACFDLENLNNVSLLQEAGVDFDWGISPMPYFETPIVHTGSVTVGVSARTATPDVAANFVVGISTGDHLLQFAEEDTKLPVLQSVGDKMEIFQKSPYDIFKKEISEWGQPRPPSPRFVEYDQYVTDALRDIAYGTDPEEALDEAVSSLEPLLGR